MEVVMLLLPLFACTGQPEIETKDTADGETVDTADTADTVETWDTVETGDTGGEPSGTPLTFLADGDTDGVALGLFPISDFETFIVYDPLFTLPFASPVTVDPSVPPEELVTPADGYPGTEVAFAVIAAWEDDGDLTHEDGENYVSASRVGLWIGGTLPDDFDTIGLRLGWNALLITDLYDSGVPTVLDPDAIELPLMEWRERGTFGGSYAGDPDGVSVAAVPPTVGEGVFPATYLYDEPLEGYSWTATFDGPPPADHYVDIDGDGLTEGLEFFLAYEDTREPDGFGAGDTLGNPACYDGEVVLVYWLERFDELVNAVVWEASGLTPGWNVIRTGDEGGVVDASAWTELTFTRDCGF